MFNKPLTMVISNVQPMSREIAGAEAVTDIMITGIIHKQKAEIFDDIELGDAKPGLKTLLTGNLPIEWPVKLAFSPRFDTKLKFPGCKNPLCELKHIEITKKPDEDKLIQLKLKVKALDVHPEDCGEIVTHLKQTVDVEISANQMELFSKPN